MSDHWNGRRCLVTGGAGFGGSHLSIELAHRGSVVYVLDRALPHNSYLALSGMERRVAFVQGDIRDLELLRLTIEREQIDTIFHLAAQPLVPLSCAAPFETLSVNVMGTYAILEAMRTTETPKCLVLASSGAHYGATSADSPISEHTEPCNHTNLYGPSKTAADVAARAYASVYGLHVAACRFMNTYGPGDMNFSRIVPRAIRTLLQGASYEFGDREDGCTRLDFLHIRDMTNAYLYVAEQIHHVRGHAINFGSGSPISTAELARMVSRLFDGTDREPLFHGTRRSEPLIKYLDIGKAERLLGWRPTTSLEHGLSETIEWYRSYSSPAALQRN